MPFKCFKYNYFYTSSKRYHTAAKHNATAFFDSSFNYIKQNSHLLSLESISNGARNYPNPHPANSATTNYLQFDYNSNNNILLNDDDNNSSNAAVSPATIKSNENTLIDDSLHTHLSNPITLIFPYQLQQVALAINKSNYQQILKKVPAVNVTDVLNSSAKLSPSPSLQPQSHLFNQQNQPAIQRHHLHTSALVHNKLEDIKSSPTLLNSEEQEPKFFQPVTTEKIPDIELSDATFLREQSERIYVAYDQHRYRRIHSHYMAIKRNNIVPSREIYTIVLSSITKRSIDDTLDDKLSTMLNVYQDLIQHKIKPDLAIYSVVINDLLEGSIKSSLDSNISSNGADFFKIAIDIFNASNCSQVQNFDNHIIDSILIGMNLYPNVVNMDSLMNLLDKQENFNKNHIYYIGLINNCKLTNDSEKAIRLYEEFKTESLKSPLLAEKQFLIYSTFISTLVSTGEITLATKFLDKLLSTIKNYEEFEPKLTMLLSSYIITLSKQNIGKALEIWSQFNSIDWIPEFSYEFYSNLLYQTQEFNDAERIYNYMVCLPKTDAKTKLNKLNLETILIDPIMINDSISRFLISAIQYDHKQSVLKVIKESFIRKTTFDMSVYPLVFYYLNNVELTTKILNLHGCLMNNGFEFLSYLTSVETTALSPQELIQTKFFQKLVQDYKLDKLENYDGFYKIFNSVFTSESPNSLETLELCASLIIEFHDLDNYYVEIPNIETREFKDKLTKFFKQTVEENNLTSDNLKSETIADAIKLLF